MTEKVVRFGPGDGLVGVLCESAAGLGSTPVVLLFNAGLLPRVGPFCWFVTLARRLADQGISSLRFDLSGLGDSPARPGPGAENERAVEDLHLAMDYLEGRRGAKGFVLFGLCSGAFQAHGAAMTDARVRGVIFLDGYGYATCGYWWRHYASRLFRLRPWVNFVRRQIGRWLPGLAQRRHPRAPTFDAYHLDFPPRTLVQQQLQEMIERPTRLLFIYTGGLAPYYFNHQCQFREMFGRLVDSPLVATCYLPQADHLFCDLQDRAWMMAKVIGWLSHN